MILEVCILLAGGLLVYSLIVNRRQNYPPGPFKLPILGNIHNLIFSMDEDGLAKHFLGLSHKYGKIFSFDLGSYRTVVLNDYKFIKECWSNPLLTGRVQSEALKYRTRGVQRGILFNDGEEWSEQRRFALRHLKDFGFGKRSMETLVLDEITELINGLLKDAGTPISTQNRFNAAVLNALWSISVGERFHHDDPKLLEVLQTIQQGIANTGGKNPALFMPWLMKLAPNLTGWNNLKSIIPDTYNFLVQPVQKIIAEYEGGSPQHFAHVFIDEMRQTTDENSSFYGKRGEKTMISVLMDLFQAGAETTSTTLTWLFLYMAVYPDIQIKLQEEIDQVLGKKQPTNQDRYKMPITESIILETLRYSSMVPLGLFHRALEDITYKNYLIPKNTLIVANLYAAHFDPTLWENPHVFNPDRFLSADRKSIIKYEGLLAFSSGKRLCLGETLARIQLFLFTTCIFQRFSVTWDPKQGKPSLAKSIGSIVGPRPHMVILTERQSITPE